MTALELLAGRRLWVERTRSHTLEAAIPGSLTSLLPPSDRFKW